MNNKLYVMCFSSTFLLLLIGQVIAQDNYSPYLEQSYPQNVYWGDTHLHTNLSLDANFSGNKKLGPDDAYRFALGETVVAHNGMKAKLHRPLDFLVIADHGINLGVMNGLETRDPILLQAEKGKSLYQTIQKARNKSGNENYIPNEILASLFSDAVIEYKQPIWQRVTSNADKYNDPGKFTAFIGYEWTPPLEQNDGLGVHRVLIFRDGADKANQTLPFTTYDSSDPEELWRYMANYEEKSGGEILAIPHNGNLSVGSMFALQDVKGVPLSRKYAESRSRWEPLYEVTQIKGDGETHPLLSPNDEFSDYETLVNTDYWFWKHSKRTEEWRRRYEYARSALKLGLQQQTKIGINPFKFGMIGSTDSHTSLSTAEENNFWGKMTDREPSPHRLEIAAKWKYAASGYAAVWARENTRESLFDAMKRKEVYATTGPRITLRFFGGWDFSELDAFRFDLAKIGYRKGVPMGGDLTNGPKSKSPSFLIRAIKDPSGANLDRVQIIKGWREESGELREKVFNAAWSDRINSEPENLPAVGSTVTSKDTSYTNTIGAAELAVVWTDPDFNSNELAFYYVRVIEIPTPRWTAYDARFFNLNIENGSIPMVTQERAYSSPIWYTP